MTSAADRRRNEDPAAQSPSELQTMQVVIFQLSHREYAFPVVRVAEILPMVAMMPVPESPPWFPGMINLRGSSLPVVDLRVRLGLPPKDLDPDSVIIVCEPQTRAQVGFVADSIVGISALATDAVDAVEEVSGSEHLTVAVARREDRLVFVLDVDRLALGANLGGVGGAAG